VEPLNVIIKVSNFDKSQLWGQGKTAGPYPGWRVTKGRYCCPEACSWLFSRGDRCVNIASLHPRTSVHGEEIHPTRGDPVAQNTADLKE